jgi:hypothetical protein
MPQIFADYHDSLLQVFLKNKYKKINSDQRLLYGKNKYGYIMPIILQLQRVCTSNSD